MRSVWVLFLVAVSVLGCGDDDGGGAPSTCGNNVLEATELCDYVNNVPMFNMASCTGVGMPAGGLLMCERTTCSFDTSMCMQQLPTSGTGG